MKNLNYLNLILLIILPLGLSSCGDKYYTDDFLRNSDSKLCNYDWVEQFVTENNELCVQTLRFDVKKSGKHTLEYYRAASSSLWESKPYRTESFNYSWSWGNDMEGLSLDFGGGDIRFFDNVWVRDYYLSGVWYEAGVTNGYSITFVRSDSPD